MENVHFCKLKLFSKILRREFDAESKDWKL